MQDQNTRFHIYMTIDCWEGSERFTLRLSQIVLSDPKVSLHCMSCKENHPHLYVLHKEKTSEQMQQQEIDCYGRNQKYPCRHWALFYGGQQKEIWQQTGRLGQDTYSITTRIGQFRIHQSTTICSNQDNIISYSSKMGKKKLKTKFDPLISNTHLYSSYASMFKRYSE